MLNYTRPQSWNFDGVTLMGTSWAGMATSLIWKEAGICFDVGQGLPWAINAQAYCITHGHQDHAGGIPYIISQRALMNLPPGRFFMPEALVTPLHEIMQIWQKIERHQYQYEFIGVKAGEIHVLKPGLKMVPFATTHRVPSLGYTLMQEKKKLRANLAGASESEISRRHVAGEIVDEVRDDPVLSFTGDTQVEFLSQAKPALSSKVLVTEVTYFGNKNPPSVAREWGHLHWDELCPRLDELKCERLLLMHFSARYSMADIESELRRTVPSAWRERVCVFPR